MNPAPWAAAPVPVIAWGPGWLVADKPAGLTVHNAPGADLCALLGQFLQSRPELQNALAVEPAYGIHPVHRLDKETSGLILLACQRSTFKHLAQQFTRDRVSKEYLALVHGHVPDSDDSSQWRSWQWPLAPAAGGRRNLQGTGKRSPCHTRYRPLRHSRHYSLIQCRLITGRTHQIRRHCALAGHPVLGDRRYGSARACRFLENRHQLRRLALHAAALEIPLPGSNEARRFAAGGLPEELLDIFNADGA